MEGILIFALVVLLLVVVAVYVIDKTMPGDINWVAKLIVGIVALLAILSRLGFSVPGL